MNIVSLCLHWTEAKRIRNQKPHEERVCRISFEEEEPRVSLIADTPRYKFFACESFCRFKKRRKKTRNSTFKNDTENLLIWHDTHYQHCRIRWFLSKLLIHWMTSLFLFILYRQSNRTHLFIDTYLVPDTRIDAMLAQCLMYTAL